MRPTLHVGTQNFIVCVEAIVLLCYQYLDAFSKVYSLEILSWCKLDCS